MTCICASKDRDKEIGKEKKLNDFDSFGTKMFQSLYVGSISEKKEFIIET